MHINEPSSRPLARMVFLKKARAHASAVRDRVATLSSQVRAFARDRDGRAPAVRASVEAEGAHPIVADLAAAVDVSKEELLVADETMQEQCDALMSAYVLLEKEHGRYRDLFDNAPEAYVVTTRSGVVEEANRAAAELLQMPAEFLVEKNLLHFVARGDTSTFRNAIRELPRRRVDGLALELRPRRAPCVRVVLSASSILDGHGALVAIRWIIRKDVTSG